MASVTERASERNTHPVIEAEPAPVKIAPYQVRAKFPRRVASTPDITPAQVKVLIVLYDMAYQTGEAYPKQGTIASELGLSRPEVSRALTGAAELGLVQIVRRQHGALYLLPWSSRFGSDVIKSAHRKRKKTPARCDEKRTSDVTKSAHLGAAALYSPNLPIERTSSSSESGHSQRAAAERNPTKAEGRTTTVTPIQDQDAIGQVVEALTRCMVPGTAITEATARKALGIARDAGGDHRHIVYWVDTRTGQRLRIIAKMLDYLEEHMPATVAQCTAITARMTPPTPAATTSQPQASLRELIQAAAIVNNAEGCMDSEATLRAWDELDACPACHGDGKTDAGYCGCTAGQHARRVRGDQPAQQIAA